MRAADVEDGDLWVRGAIHGAVGDQEREQGLGSLPRWHRAKKLARQQLVFGICLQLATADPRARVVIVLIALVHVNPPCTHCLESSGFHLAPRYLVVQLDVANPIDLLLPSLLYQLRGKYLACDVVPGLL
eukprot:5556300-Pyramimonas_sp.AAC.1